MLDEAKKGFLHVYNKKVGPAARCRKCNCTDRCQKAVWGEASCTAAVTCSCIFHGKQGVQTDSFSVFSVCCEVAPRLCLWQAC